MHLLTMTGPSMKACWYGAKQVHALGCGQSSSVSPPLLAGTWKEGSLIVRPCAGFTCSAGIAANKLLAKVGSALHKPNQQTIVPPRCLPSPPGRSWALTSKHRIPL
jgi:hypothetical protein